MATQARRAPQFDHRMGTFTQATAWTVVVALVAVGLVRFVAGWVVPLDPMYQPTEWGAIIPVTAFAAVAASAVYWLLGRFMDRPDRMFVVVAVVVLVGLSIPLFTLPLAGETAGGIATALAMHVAAALAIVAALLRWAPVPE